MYNAGDKVFWTDPDEGICSGEFEVISVETDIDEAHDLITLANDTGSVAQAYPHELERI